MIKSYVGGHGIKVFTGCSYDPQIRKYRGGTPVAEIPYSGQMLSVHYYPDESGTLNFNGVALDVKLPRKVKSIDPLPSGDPDELYVVSALYVAGCKTLGIDTSRLLTIGDTVVNDDGTVIGCINFIRY